LKIALIQTESCANLDTNIAAVEDLVLRAVLEEAPQLVALPETWNFVGDTFSAKLRSAETLPSEDDPHAGPAYTAMRQLARRHGIFLHGGSINERVGERLFNTTVVFSPLGEELARYRKLHLFDADTPDGSGYRESAEYGAGSRLVTYAVESVTVGCAICYDLRFPEQFLALRRAGADLIVVPSAFTLHTGRDHWEVLLRARAIETQCWIAAPSMWGTHFGPGGEPRTTYGHSLLVDPWGQMVGCASDGVGWIAGRLDAARAAQIRAAMPVMNHRTLLDRLMW
jgi:nitrilase